MHISTKDDETNYAWHFDGPVDILLNGKKVYQCFEADDEAGYVIRPKSDAHGNLVVIDGEIQTMRQEGRVEFIGKRRELWKSVQ